MSTHYSQIILKPLINEKSIFLGESGQYTFAVHKDANKIAIARAVQELIKELYPQNKAKVTSVNTLASRGRFHRSKRHGRTPKDTKKAIVTIEGDKLDFYGA